MPISDLEVPELLEIFEALAPGENPKKYAEEDVDGKNMALYLDVLEAGAMEELIKLSLILMAQTDFSGESQDFVRGHDKKP